MSVRTISRASQRPARSSRNRYRSPIHRPRSICNRGALIPHVYPKALWVGTSDLAQIVFVARDGATSISACQREFLTAEGKKAQVDPVKRTNGVLRGAAMSLPGEGETLACEGPEDALTLWQATNRPVLCVLGVSGLAMIPLEAGQPVTVCRDNDDLDAAATAALKKAVAALSTSRLRVHKA
jgi:Toprim domain